MSRHRNYRNYDYGDEDDYYDDGSDYGMSPASPSLSQFMYRREDRSLNSFLQPQYESAEQQQANVDVVAQRRVGEVLDVLGREHFTEDDAMAALHATDWDVALAIDALLQSDAAPGHGDEEEMFAFDEPSPDDRVAMHGHTAVTAQHHQNDDVVFHKQPQQPQQAPPPHQPQGQQGKKGKKGKGKRRKGGAAFDDDDDDRKVVFVSEPPPPVTTTSTTTTTTATTTTNTSTAAVTKQVAGLRIDPVSPASSGGASLDSPSAGRFVNVHMRSKKVVVPDDDAGGKPRINLVVVGHVDAGKSTLMGHTMHVLGNVDDRQMHKLKKESAEMGKASFHFAWVLDAHAEERERGVTMDVGVSHFDTPERSVTLLDAPGHRDFIPKMIAGATQADAAVLAVDASVNAFEAGFEAGGQTKEHAMLVRSLGVTQLVVAVNKLDTTDYSRERFDEVAGMLTAFLTKQARFNKRNLTFVPVSGLSGENLVRRSDPRLAAWYHGPTLINAIDQLRPPERPTDRPFRLTVSDTYRNRALGQAVAGRVEAGVLAPGDKVLVLPAFELATVKAMQCRGAPADVARAGDNADVGVVGVEETHLGVGSVLCDPMFPAPLVSRFRARLITMDVRVPIVKGASLVLFAHNLQEPVVVRKLLAVLDKNGEVKRRRPKFLVAGQTADVVLDLPRRVVLDTYAASKALGRFTLRASGVTVAAGMVTKLHRQRPLRPEYYARGGRGRPRLSEAWSWAVEEKK